MSRLLFRRYLIPGSPAVLILTPALVVCAVLAGVLLLGGTDTAGAPTTPGAAGDRAAGDRATRGPGTLDENPATAAPAPARAGSLSLTFVGDIMAHDVNHAMADYDRIYEDVRAALQGDDLTFANLETPVIAERPRAGYPRFNAHPDYVAAALRAGVEVISAANNHTNDWGLDGVHATRRALAGLAAEHGASVAGLRAEAHEPLRPIEIRRRGRRIGVVAVTQMHNNPAAGSELVHTVDYRSEHDVEALREHIAEVAGEFDLLVLSYHGGREYASEPDPAKAEVFERLVEAGVDILWSHHPHVVQPWRVLEVPDRGAALILHSTGNFISGQTWHLRPEHAATRRAHTGDTPLFTVRVSWDADGGIALDHAPLLAVNYRDPAHGMVIRRLDELVASDIDPRWKRYYVVRRNALREIVWRSEQLRLAALE